MSAHPELERWDERTASERKAVLEHVVGCASCRERFVAEDATRWFALLSLRPVPEKAQREVSDSVRDAIRGVRPGAGSLLPDRVLAQAAGWAASVLVVTLAAVLLYLSSGKALTPSPQIAASTGEPSARVEVLSSPGTANVVDLTVGPTQLVMIFDPQVDL